MTTIVLAEDHTVVRQGLRALLDPEFDVVAETGDGLEVADVVERTQPDILLLDLMMPGLNGLDAARQISRRSPNTRIVILSMHSDESYVVEALKSGVYGYVLKGSDSNELIRAIRECAAGRHYLSPPLTERAIQAYTDKATATLTDSYEELTPRERQVLHLAAEGFSNPDIATRLSISVRTAETHRANLMRKLGLHTQAELIHYAVGRGIVKPK